MKAVYGGPMNMKYADVETENKIALHRALRCCNVLNIKRRYLLMSLRTVFVVNVYRIVNIVRKIIYMYQLDHHGGFLRMKTNVFKESVSWMKMVNAHKLKKISLSVKNHVAKI